MKIITNHILWNCGPPGIFARFADFDRDGNIIERGICEKYGAFKYMKSSRRIGEIIPNIIIETNIGLLTNLKIISVTGFLNKRLKENL